VDFLPFEYALLVADEERERRKVERAGRDAEATRKAEETRRRAAERRKREDQEYQEYVERQRQVEQRRKEEQELEAQRQCQQREQEERHKRDEARVRREHQALELEIKRRQARISKLITQAEEEERRQDKKWFGKDYSEAIRLYEAAAALGSLGSAAERADYLRRFRKHR
jgi:dTMP kinase